MKIEDLTNLFESAKGRLQEEAKWLGRQVTRVTSSDSFAKSRSVQLVIGAAFVAIAYVFSKVLQALYPKVFPNHQTITDQEILNELIAESEFEPVSDTTVDTSTPSGEKTPKERELDSLISEFNSLQKFSPSELDSLLERAGKLSQELQNLDGEGLSKPLHSLSVLIQFIKCIKDLVDSVSSFSKGTVGENDIIAVSADGNCWLYSALIGLRFAGRIQDDYTYTQLRNDTVAWLKENQNETQCKAHLDSAIEAYKTAKIREIDLELASLGAMRDLEESSKEQLQEAIQGQEERKALFSNFTYEDYFQMMSQDKAFGGEAEFYAISKIFHVNVEVSRVVPQDNIISLSRDYDVQFMQDREFPTVRVVMNQLGDHFNAQLPSIE